MSSQTIDKPETTQAATWPVWRRQLENALNAVGAGVYFSEAHSYYLQNFTVRAAMDAILVHRRGDEL